MVDWRCCVQGERNTLRVVGVTSEGDRDVLEDKVGAGVQGSRETGGWMMIYSLVLVAHRKPP